MTPLAFIGTGIMGLPMALRLQEAGHPIFVHTRTKSRASALLNNGAKFMPSPTDAAAKADVVFLCLPDTPDVQQTVLGEKGIIASARSGLIVVDHSTISPAATRELSSKLNKKHVKFLDAPVSGGDVGAKNGTLSIMVGGDKKAFQTVEPILRLMGKTITYCGGSGNGQVTKLVNQILVGVTLMGVAEALVFAKKNGLDLQKTIDAVSGGAAGSWQLSNLGPKMVRNNNHPGFMINLMQKDLRILMQAAEDTNTSMPAASLVHQLFTAAQAAGHGKHGTQAIHTVLEKLASLH